MTITQIIQVVGFSVPVPVMYKKLLVHCKVFQTKVVDAMQGYVLGLDDNEASTHLGHFMDYVDKCVECSLKGTTMGNYTDGECAMAELMDDTLKDTWGDFSFVKPEECKLMGYSGMTIHRLTHDCDTENFVVGLALGNVGTCEYSNRMRNGLPEEMEVEDMISLLASTKKKLTDEGRVGVKLYNVQKGERPLGDVISEMLLPVRCFSCGKPLPRWDRYQELLSQGKSENIALTTLGLRRACCRRMVLCHVELIDDLIKYSAHNTDTIQSKKTIQ